jgi:hypothetical protein
MTPQEKAKELFDKFYNYADSNYGASEFEKNWHGNVLAGERKVRKESAKQCVLTAVDEIINSRPLEPNNVDWDDCGATHKYWYDTQKEEALKFWQEVKQEIEKL